MQSAGKRKKNEHRFHLTVHLKLKENPGPVVEENYINTVNTENVETRYLTKIRGREKGSGNMV